MSLRFDCHYQYADGFHVDLTFETRSACTVLWGPSGSGKTTVLSLIAGILQPDSGRISLGEQVLVDTSGKVLLPIEQRRIGYVFQDPLLFPHLTVRQNIDYGKRYRQGSTSAIDVTQVIDVLQIEDLLDRRPSTLSGGEKQRVALGRALASSPSLLLMDEPVSSLDEELKLSVLECLRTAIAEWQLTTVYVTHSREEVDLLEGETLAIDQGGLCDEHSRVQ